MSYGLTRGVPTVGNKTKVLIPSMLEVVPSGGLVNVIQRLAEQIRNVGADAMILEGLIPVTERVFLHEEEGPRRALLEEARKSRPLADVLIARVFPGVARLLDSGWADDRLSFVDVTIAATRLQDAVRTLGRFHLPAPDLATLLMIVPHWEQHSLPATFAAEHLRSIGAPTRLLSGLCTTEIVGHARRSGPSAILLSAGSYRSVGRLPDLIRALRKDVPRAIPIIVGGPAMSRDAEALKRTGADLATNNIVEALKFSGFDLRTLNTSLIEGM